MESSSAFQFLRFIFPTFLCVCLNTQKVVSIGHSRVLFCSFLHTGLYSNCNSPSNIRQNSFCITVDIHGLTSGALRDGRSLYLVSTLYSETIETLTMTYAERGESIVRTFSSVQKRRRNALIWPMETTHKVAINVTAKAIKWQFA